MEINNVIEISVGITIAILGIAYPILIDKISNIGQKYSSDYLPEIFNKEPSQRIFKPILIATLSSFIFLIFSFKLLFGLDNFFINNSAEIIVFLLSFLLIIFFFLWTSKVFLYNGKPTDLLRHIISKHNSKTKDKDYYLKTINDFSYYSIKKKDEHIQKTLVDFYYKQFNNQRQAHDKTKPIVYSYELYNLVYKITLEASKNKDHYLPVLKNRAISGLWLLGESFDEISISKETYQWLWINLNLIADNHEYVQMYWSTATQHILHKLYPIIPDDYNIEENTYGNQSLVNKRENEIKIFKKFHYAFGGLLLFKNNYVAIKNNFSYTQSHPPEYPLLPYHMDTVFYIYEFFLNDHKSEAIMFEFPFSGLNDTFGADIKYWIGSYITLLFIRQFFLPTYYIYQEPTSQPTLPDNITDLNSWLNKLSVFKYHLSETLEKRELLQQLGYSINKEQLYLFLEKLENNLKVEIKQKEYNREVSDEKLERFNKSTERILCNAFEGYSKVLNEIDISNSEHTTKYRINGLITLHPKNAFAVDVEHLNYNTFFAEQIANRKIKSFFPNSFASAKTKRYLLNMDDVLSAINKLNIDDEFIIVAIKPNDVLKDKIKKYSSLVQEIDVGYNSLSFNSLFILRKKDLPYIKFIEPDSKDINKNELSKLNNCKYPIYTSVLDLNIEKYSEIKKKWKNLENNNDDELRKQVQVTIWFIAQIIWKKEREVVQINIKNRYKEQGIANSISDIEAFNKEK